MTRIVVIPDTHCKPGGLTSHLEAAGNAIVEYRPDVVVHLGDNWDMHSLSDHEPAGHLDREGARLADDIDAGSEGIRLLSRKAIMESSRLTFHHKRRWKPRLVFLDGNHEYRLTRYVEARPELLGALPEPELPGWERHAYREIVEIYGILFSHCFYRAHSDRPISGSAMSRIVTIGRSFVQGHVQGMDYAMREYCGGVRRHGLVAGSFYQHAEKYRGPQNANEWRGIVVLNDVRNGDYDVMPLSLSYLLKEFL